jgi:PAS domain S-box-containing protein
MSGQPPIDDVERLFSGESEMARRVRAFDWSRTPVGPMTSWPQSLRTMVRVMLDSRYAMWLGWGRDFTFFYNDAYAEMTLGPKHPWALGRPAREVWAEIWNEIGPRAESVVTTGRATWDEGLLLFLQRKGFTEETYHTFSYSPVPDDDGSIGGMLCVVTEDTQRTIADRRLRTLRELAARTTEEARSRRHACQSAIEVLAGNRRDLPFVDLYLLEDEGRRAVLAGSTGDGDHAPRAVDLETDTPWPFREVVRTGRAVEIPDLVARFGAIAGSAWPEPPRSAVVLPMAKPGQTRLAGLVVAGISPRLTFDDDYRGFLELLAGHIAAAVANAQAYEEERRRAAALEELDRAKTTFFSNISHEFRTPLTLMLGPLESALAAPELANQERASLELAQRNAKRLLRLVNTLLDFSRIEAGRVDAVFEQIDLGRTTAELASVFRAAIQQAGLFLRVECATPNAPVFVDREMWEKVVLNLLSNAFKFTFTGGIAVALAERPGFVDLTVRDTGTGIPADQLPHVFERFHRVRGTEGRTHEGSGIGLALVSELVRIHGGTVRVESTLGEGSAFTVSLPTGAAHLPPERIGVRPAQPASQTVAAPFADEALRWVTGTSEVPAAEDVPIAASSGMRIVVADDNADMRDYVSRILGETCEVESVADGRQALDAMRRRRPDLLLSDVMMPRLDGFGLLREVRADPALRTVPVILLSARAGEESRVGGLQAGADDYLTKPFSARELIARVHAHLEMARIRADAVSERERAAERLRAEEARYRALVEATSSIVWRADHTGAVTDAARWTEAAGQSYADMLGDGWIAIVHPEDRARTLDVWARAMRDKTPASSEHRLRNPDGTYRWMAVTAVPILGSDGSVEEWIGTASDIDVRKRAELDRHRFVSLAENSSEFIGMCDLSFRPFFVNAAGLAKVGLDSLEAAQSKDVRDYFYPEDHSVLVERFLPEVLRQGAAEIEIRFRHFETHEPIWMLFNVFVLTDLEGNRIGYGTFSRDVTERRRANEVLRARTSELQAVVETAPVGIWFAKDPSCRPVEGNRVAMEMLGLDGDDPAARLGAGDAPRVKYRTFKDGVEIGEAAMPLQRAVATGRPVLDEEIELEVDGRPRLALLVSAVPLLGPDGTAHGGIAVTLDITERKRAAHEREVLLRMAESARADAETANRAKDEFLAVLSHELRSPMNAIVGWLRVLKTTGTRDAALVARAVDTLERNVWIQAQVINDLLDVSRIMSGKLELERTRVDFGSVVTGCVESMRPSAEGKQVALRLRVPSEDTDVVGDSGRLQQIVSNLLGNAIKFTEAGGSIRVEVEQTDDSVILVVEDTGAGIEPGFLPHLFERFRQADSTSQRRHGGLGLGLAIVKNLVALHGGQVTAESEGIGRGTRFTVTLPRAEERRPVALHPPLDLVASDGALLPQLDVLLVDDDADSRAALELFLEECGATVRTADSVRNALRAYNQRPPDVIVSDIGMPEENGYVLIRAIREREEGRRHRTLAIAITGFAGRQDREMALRAGYDDHLAKPIEPTVLRERVRALEAGRGRASR